MVNVIYVKNIYHGLYYSHLQCVALNQRNESKLVSHHFCATT